MSTVAESVAKATSECADPIRAAVRETVRDARRAVVAGRHAVEDCTDATVIEVRRHPLLSLGIAAGVGLIVGGAIVMTVGRAGAHRSAPSAP